MKYTNIFKADISETHIKILLRKLNQTNLPQIQAFNNCRFCMFVYKQI